MDKRDFSYFVSVASNHFLDFGEYWQDVNFKIFWENKMKNDVIKHYDLLIDEGNDPVHDPESLREYMNKWDGQDFINSMQLDKTKKYSK